MGMDFNLTFTKEGYAVCSLFYEKNKIHNNEVIEYT